MMRTRWDLELAKYDTDVIAWSLQQAEFLRTAQFDKLDIEHLADEIEDVGKAEVREFERRMAELIASLIRWQYQPHLRGSQWTLIINGCRMQVHGMLKETPSLAVELKKPRFCSHVWADGARMAESVGGPYEKPYLTSPAENKSQGVLIAVDV